MESFDFEFNTTELDLSFDSEFAAEHNNRYINPPKDSGVPDRHVKYEHAEDFAKALKIGQGGRAHAIVSGNFVAGDLIEAIFVEKNIHTDLLSISTLSLSENNIDSLKNLLDGGYVDKIDLVVSDFFFSHERRALIPYMLEQLDYDNRFQLGVAGIHTKIAIFETQGFYYSIHGSANLRSSGCVEQIIIEEGREAYEFYKEFHDRIITQYSVINKSIRSEKLWQAVATVEVVDLEQKEEEEKAHTPTAFSRRGKRRFKNFHN